MEWCFQFLTVKLDESNLQYVIILCLFQEEFGILPPSYCPSSLFS